MEGSVGKACSGDAYELGHAPIDSAETGENITEGVIEEALHWGEDEGHGWG